MKKPLIGINPYDIKHKDSMWSATKEAYCQAIWRNDGYPVTLSHTKNTEKISSLVSKMDSFLMVGGPDIPAKTYNSKNPQLLDPDIMSNEREAFDRAIFLEAMNQNKKILAVCAGAQHANVILGGTLIEDIPTLIKNHVNHGVFNGAASTHAVNTTNKNSLLYKIIQKESFNVKSSHHQCINAPGNDIVITARAEDGTVEAIEIVGHNNFVGVQWHPETMPKSENMKKLFLWLSS